VNSPADAYEGSSFFQTSEYLDLSFSRELTQTVDVSQYTGTIEEVHISVAMAANYGYAETTGTDPHTWEYYAQVGLLFFDAQGNGLPAMLYGPCEVGNDALVWSARTESWTDAFPSVWSTVKSQIASIEVGFSGGWLRDGAVFEDPPTGAIVDIPELGSV